MCFYTDSHWINSVLQYLVVFMSYLHGGCEKKSTIPVIRSSYRLVSGQRQSSFKTVPPPRDRLSLGGKVSWFLGSCWFVPDHIQDTSSSIPMSRHKRSALVVTWNFFFWQPQRDRLWEAFLHGF